MHEIFANANKTFVLFNLAAHCNVVWLITANAMFYMCCVHDVTPVMFCVAGLVWNQLSDVDKAPYLRAAEEEKQKYEARMREYTAGVSTSS